VGDGTEGKKKGFNKCKGGGKITKPRPHGSPVPFELCKRCRRVPVGTTKIRIGGIFPDQCRRPARQTHPQCGPPIRRKGSDLGEGTEEGILHRGQASTSKLGKTCSGSRGEGGTV